jgi:hypothetical protein
MVDLQIEPKLGRCAQRLAESKRSIGCNARLLAGDPLNSRSRQAADLGKSARRHFERNKELLPQNLPRMHGLELLVIWRPLLVVVHDLGLWRSFCRPDQAHSKLIVDPDRVLPLAIARQRFQAVAWRRPQVTQRRQIPKDRAWRRADTPAGLSAAKGWMFLVASWTENRRKGLNSVDCQSSSRKAAATRNFIAEVSCASSRAVYLHH